MEKEFKNFEDEVFVAYIDEYGEVLRGYFKILWAKNNLISFKSNRGNIFVIPVNRLLKIKSKEAGNNGHTSASKLTE